MRATCLGPPFRLGMTFHETNSERLRFKRTLYIQELLKAGIITYNGIMLPSYAHTEHELAVTLDSIGKALEIIQAADRQDAFHRYLEIP